jgi:glycine cleavage system aminomethyltransferase T
MHIRRIEAGILNAGSDFDHTTTPYDAGLGMFVDQNKGDFIGKEALEKAPKDTRLIGLLCAAEPHIGAEIRVGAKAVGQVTAGAMSPFLKQGIGIALMLESGNLPDAIVTVGCIDGEFHQAKLAELPLYDKEGEIQRGKRVDIPLRD